MGLYGSRGESGPDGGGPVGEENFRKIVQIAKAGAVLVVVLLVGCVTTSDPGYVSAYLEAETKDYRKFNKQFAVDGPYEPVRFEMPPSVHIMQRATGTEARAVAEAVKIINGALPASFQLTFDPNDRWVEEGAGTELWKGKIFVLFWKFDEAFRKALKERGETIHPRAFDKQGAMGLPLRTKTDWEPHFVDSGMVHIDTAKLRVHGNPPLVGVVIHELLHVFGKLHPDRGRFPDTIMNNRNPKAREYPYLRPVDVQVLQAIYGKS